MAALSLSAKEIQLLQAVMTEMGEVPTVDFEKIKGAVGHKYAKNARAAFVKVWNKLKEGTEGTAASGDGETVKPKTPSKKGAVGPKKTPKKGSEGGPKKGSRKAEKEESPVKNEESLIEKEESPVEDKTPEEHLRETEMNDLITSDGKSRLSIPVRPQVQQITPEFHDRQLAEQSQDHGLFHDGDSERQKSELQDQLMIRKDGFPEETSDQTIKEEAALIGMEEGAYRNAVKEAMEQQLSGISNI